MFSSPPHGLHFDCICTTIACFWLHTFSAWINATNVCKPLTMNKTKCVHIIAMAMATIRCKKKEIQKYREFARELSRRKAILNKDWAFNHHIQFQTEHY